MNLHGTGPASHYDRVTAAWTLLLGDELHYGVFDGADEALSNATRRLTRTLMDRAEIEPRHHVLDVGCGTGAPACFVADALGAHVTGISTSAEGIRAAEARAKRGGLEGRVEFELRDGMENGYPDGSFDRVLALESSHLMRRRDRFVSESARVLRDGGRFVLCDIVLGRTLEFAEVKRLREPLVLLREVFGDARMETVSTYRQLLSEANLHIEYEENLTKPTRPTFSKWRENASRHRDRVVELLGEEDWRKFLGACDVLEGFWDDGTLGYALLSASKP